MTMPECDKIALPQLGALLHISDVARFLTNVVLLF